MQDNHRESRNSVIKKIRRALIHKTNNRFANIEWEKSVYKRSNDSPEEAFAKAFKSVGGQFVFCENEIDFVEKLLNLSEQNKWKKILCWENGIQSLLDKYEFPYSTDSENFEDGITAITSCEALIARLGSIMVSSRKGSGRRLAIIPTSHIVLAYTSQLVPDIKDGLQLIRNKYNEQFPSMIGTITGPSRTADIEKTLVTPAHGPRDIFVFLIDDSKVS